MFDSSIDRVLKPFIRRDYQSSPLKLRLLQEIRAYPHRLDILNILG